MLRGFFRAMDEADLNDIKLVDAIDLSRSTEFAAGRRVPLAVKLMPKLEAMLRKLQVDLNSISDDWNSPPLRSVKIRDSPSKSSGSATGAGVSARHRSIACRRYLTSLPAATGPIENARRSSKVLATPWRHFLTRCRRIAITRGRRNVSI